MIGFIDILLNIGMIINFFHKDIKEYLYKNYGIGIVQIVILILSFWSLAFIIIKYNSKLFNNNE